MSKELMETDSILKEEEWYIALLEELKAILTESVFISRIELLRGKWLVGERIVKDKNYEKIQGQQDSESFIQRVARDLGRSNSDVYACVKFFEKYPATNFSNALEELPEDKNISWHKMVNKYLPDKTRREKREKIQEECKHDGYLKCLGCQKIFKVDVVKCLKCDFTFMPELKEKSKEDEL